MITKNAQTDQFSGVYEVCFTLSLLSAPEDGFICRTEVLGEAGNTIIAAYDLQRSDLTRNVIAKKRLTTALHMFHWYLTPFMFQKEQRFA